MKLKNQIKQDIETFKKIPDNNRKFAYVMEYYGFAIATTLVVLFLVLSSAFNMIFQDEVILHSVLVNSDALVVECDDSIFGTLLEAAEINMERKAVEVNTDLYLGLNQSEDDVRTLQVLTALFTISDLDIYVSDEASFKIFADENAFANLALLLDTTTLEKYKEDLYIVTIDGNEYVAGIYLHKESPLHKAGYYHNDVVIGIANTAVNFDNALTLLKEILK